MSDQSQQSRCPLECSGESVVVYPQKDVIIRRCRQCSMMWLDPVPSRQELQEFYDEGTLYPEWDRVNLRSSWPLEFYKRRLDMIARFRPPGRRVLDVGVGFGHFLLAAPDEWDVSGIDISAEVFEYVRTHHGLTIDLGVARDTYADGSFDCIHVKDVIEHITDPLEELRAYRRMLRPGGILVIETLNIGSVLARIRGARYAAFYPGHVVFFSLATLREAVRRAGFEVVRSWAGDEIPWTDYLRLRPWKSVLIRMAKKLHIGPLYMASMVLYARVPAAPEKKP